MKIRSDFVSNSSSCSFIIATTNERLKTLPKDIAKACVNKKSKYHNPELKNINERILDFCFNSFVLGFIGFLKFDNKKYPEIHTLDSPVFTHTRMSFELQRYHFEGEKYKSSKGTKDERKQRAKTLFDMAKDRAIIDYQTFIDEPNIYEITQDTLDNTKDLLEFGYKFTKSKKDLKLFIKKLETYFDNGKRIFAIKQGYDGEGYGQFYIYTEEATQGVANINGIDYLNNTSDFVTSYN